MSEIKGQSRIRRQARLAAMIVSAALMLPSFAVADHTTCDKQSNEIGSGINCPEFSPGLEAIVSNRVVDSESTVSFDYSQADHESSTMLIEAYVPKGWQFNTSIRPSDTAGACSGNAEAISGNSWRLRSVAGADRTVTERTGAAYFGDYDASTETISGCARLSGSVTLPFTLAKLPSGHAFSSTHGWKLTISTRAFIESIKAADGSLIRFVFDLNQRTSGTWHLNQAGQPERAIFSQASETPLTTDLRVQATTCRRGLSDAPADAATGCRGNSTLTALLTTDAFNLSPAPTGAPLDFAHITGPARLPGTTEEKFSDKRREGFSLVKGSNTATVTWAEPPANPDETVKAYALIVAIPGDQGSRSGKYVLAPATSVDLVAGSLPRVDGNGSLDPNFDGGKYDLALVTIYASGKRTDGRCDDGTVFGALCAPTTPLWLVRGQGEWRSGDSSAPVSAQLPTDNFGISLWQILWRTQNYASVSMETQFFSNGSGSGDNETFPFMVLFVDYTLKQAEFVIWGSWSISNARSDDLRFIAAGRAADGKATSFLSRDNRIIGDGNTGTVQFTNGASPTGTAVRFDFVGATVNGTARGLVSLVEPGDVNLGPSIPPNPTSRRKMSAAIEVLEGSAI